MSIKMRDQIQANLLDDETIDFAHYWQVFKRYSGRIILLALLFTILVGVIVMKMTPQYSAKATLLIESQPANVMSIEEVYNADTTRKDYMQTQYEIISSRQVARLAVKELGLANNDIFMPPASEENAIIAKAKSWVKSFFPGDDKSVESTPLTEEQKQEKRIRAATNRLMNALTISLVSNTHFF